MHIWNIFRNRFKCILLGINLNISIINRIMTKSPHDRQNHRIGFGRRGPVFEVSCCRLAVTLYWWISWSITTEGVELVHLYSKTGWEKWGPHMMQESALCTILPQHFQIVFFWIMRSEMTGWRVSISLLVEYEVPKLWKRWPEEVRLVGYPIISR